MNKIKKFGEKIKSIFKYDLEIIFLKGITHISFSIIIILLFLCFKLKIIDVNYTLTSIGAIIAFWYGYKKYEKDKEMEMIDKFQMGKLSIENFDDDIMKLSIAFKLYKRGYLSPSVWELIEIKNDELIYNFLKENLSFNNKTSLEEIKKEINKKTTLISNKFGILKQHGLMDYFLDILKKIESELNCLLNKKLVVKDEIKETIDFRDRISIVKKQAEDVNKKFEDC